MVDPSKYVIGPGATIDDVDLDKEEVVVGGKRLTDSDAERLAKEA